MIEQLQAIDALMLRLTDQGEAAELEALEKALLQRAAEVKAFAWYTRQLENQN